MKDVTIKKVYEGKVPRVFLNVVYKNDYEDDVTHELELFGEYAQKFLERDGEFLQKQLRGTENDLDFVVGQLSDTAREYESVHYTVERFSMLKEMIQEMEDHLDGVKGYTDTREALRAALFYLKNNGGENV